MATFEHGLSEHSLTIIKKILSETTPDIERVCLFGSRATGFYEPYSDIDITLHGDIEKSVATALYTHFIESHLPYKVDINICNYIKYHHLKDHRAVTTNSIQQKNYLLRLGDVVGCGGGTDCVGVVRRFCLLGGEAAEK